MSMTNIAKVISMKELASYQNGNTFVKIFSDGSKIREFEGEAKPAFPESIDLKITDFCDMGCAFCHEQSTKAGKEGDVDFMLKLVETLPAGVELAVGGGNPLSHPKLEKFLTKLKERGIIANITINQGHLKPYQEKIANLIAYDLVKGVGISLTKSSFDLTLLPKTPNLVFHIIAGIQEPEIIGRLIEKLENPKILILGYKEYGFGKDFFNPVVATKIEKWRKALPKYLEKCLISFDNLAIKQLNVRKLFTSEGWERFYMGDDGKFTMYIDGVSQTYAISSTKNRIALKNMSAKEAFLHLLKSEPTKIDKL
jgi:DNA-binding Lrp family transcriptional regulator